MYIHLGEDISINDKEIVTIIDLDATTISKTTRDFLANAEKTKKVFYVSRELPKTAVICRNKIYICQVAASTLEKRNRR